MSNTQYTWMLVFIGAWLNFNATNVAAADAVRVDYQQQIKPLFAKHCSACHGAKKQEAGLRLDAGAGILSGGDSGPAFVANKPHDSLLLKRVSTTDSQERMPPEGAALSAAEIQLLRDWIEQGAVAPKDETIATATVSHWAFQRPVRPAIPTVKNPAWSRNGIDRFIQQRLDEKQIVPSPLADRATMLRRLSLDLTGLPPSPDEVEAFLRDDRPDAYERTADRLLASPAYGERWGRIWLDQARYADSNGYTRDFGREIWLFREWVIQALNDDLPFDQFTIEQIAGDLLPNPSQEQLVATGFHRNTLVNEEGGTDQEQFRVDAVADRVATTGQVWLGLTLGCARCHNHKYDPISQREFYQLFAFLNNCDEPNIEAPSQLNRERGDLEQREKLRTQIAEHEKTIESQRTALEVKQREWEKSVTPEQRSRLPGPVQVAYDMEFEKRDAANKKLVEEFYRKTEDARRDFPPLEEIFKLKAAEPKIPKTMVLRERKESRLTHIHKRGDFLNLGVQVEPAVPAVLPPLNPLKRERPTRLDFARWLVDPANPLTPRVLANRHWLQLFGRGLVETEDDFGLQGSRPTHPELLNFLATEILDLKSEISNLKFQISDFKSKEAGAVTPEKSPVAWSQKRLLRTIVTSATYRQSSRVRPELREVDPRNDLLARQSRLRVDAEIVRDVALAASGLLTHVIGGPSVMPPQPDGVYAFTQDPKPWKTETNGDRYRRGMYTFFWRSLPYPMLSTFDAPNANVTCTRRVRSNTPLQSLTMANDVAFVECARALAERVLQESPGSLDQQLRFAFRVSLGRDPSAAEQTRLVEFVNRQRSSFASDAAAVKEVLGERQLPHIPPADFAAWIAASRVLLNLDEFITRE